MSIELYHKTLQIKTSGSGMYEITDPVKKWLSDINAREGSLTLFIRHTSASLTIQENADPDVQTDLMMSLDKIAPQSPHYLHQSEGADDMPAHIKSALTSTSLTIPVLSGNMVLGTWQGIYILEHRMHPHERQVVFHYMGR